MPSEEIPTKSETPHLNAFLESAREALPHARPQLLDLGCGDGRLSAEAAALGFRVVGLDINPGAIRLAQARLVELTENLGSQAGASFHCCDIASGSGLGLVTPTFDVAVCQLVISIVGDAAARRRLLKNAYDSLRLEGLLYLSASAESGEVNPTYAALYERDSASIGEPRSYYSRDEEGTILYATHHFTPDELRGLVDDAGFQDVTIDERLETSSRRPGEKANFLYLTARKL